MMDPVILAVVERPSGVCGLLTTCSGLTLEQRQWGPHQTAKELPRWIEQAYDHYGTAIVVTGPDGKIWPPELREAIRTAGGLLDLMSRPTVDAVFRQPYLRDQAVWVKRLSLLAAVWNAQRYEVWPTQSRSWSWNLRWTARLWAMEYHRWTIRQLEAEEAVDAGILDGPL